MTSKHDDEPAWVKIALPVVCVGTGLVWWGVHEGVELIPLVAAVVIPFAVLKFWLHRWAEKGNKTRRERDEG